MIIGQTVRMEKPKDRLVQAIREAGYDSPTEAWRANRRALGISKDLLISNCNGNRDISKRAAEIYARVFGHTPGWYLYNEAEPEDRDLTVERLIADYDGMSEPMKKVFLKRVLGLEAPEKSPPPASAAPATDDVKPR